MGTSVVAEHFREVVCQLVYTASTRNKLFQNITVPARTHTQLVADPPHPY
jgi:hypothetical protein